MNQQPWAYGLAVRSAPADSNPPWAALVVPPELDGRALERFCDLLTGLNEDYLRAHPETPWLYGSGAFYKLQPEFWLTIPWALRAIWSGAGLDCKSLSAWRVAELRVRENEPRARCLWSAHPTAEKLVYHVRVQRGDGRIEDPSLNLGMNAEPCGRVLPSWGGTQESAWTPSRFRY